MLKCREMGIVLVETAEYCHIQKMKLGGKVCMLLMGWVASGHGKLTLV